MPKKIDWKALYDEKSNALIADDLKTAKEKRLPYYRNTCLKHDKTVYSTQDNSCKICSNDGMKRRRKDNKPFNKPREQFFAIKRRAKEKQISFDISIEWLRNEMNTKKICPVFNVPFDDTSDFRQSVDRIDSTKGYTKDNIAIISNKANVIKSYGTIEDHLKIIEWMQSLECK